MIPAILLIIFALIISAYLIHDYRGPKTIYLRKNNLFDIESLSARDLVVHEFDMEGNLWASRGMILYCLKIGQHKFTRVAHVPTGFSFYWLNNFSLFRNFVNKPECIEATITGDGHICALSAGFLWHCNGVDKKFTRSMKLPHYGLGVGRGVLSNGLLSVGESKVYVGEYYRNSERTSVNIYVSNNNGLKWDIAHQFDPGTIRHIHTLKEDPFTGKLWFSSGDYDDESMIGWSDDGFRTINIIGKGSQSWRTAQLVFTEGAVYWGADTGSLDLAGIYRWDRASGELSMLKKNDGAILYGTRLKGGLIAFTTDREGFPNEKDDKTRLLLVKGEKDISEKTIGTWKHSKKGLKYSFAMLRTQRTQDDSFLAISVINQEEVKAGGILLIREPDLLN